LAFVPKKKLITRGPFALMTHPFYTSVALLVIPGLGLLPDTWLGFVLGLVLYLASRRFAPREERDLEKQFPESIRPIANACSYPGCEVEDFRLRSTVRVWQREIVGIPRPRGRRKTASLHGARSPKGEHDVWGSKLVPLRVFRRVTRSRRRARAGAGNNPLRVCRSGSRRPAGPSTERWGQQACATYVGHRCDWIAADVRSGSPLRERAFCDALGFALRGRPVRKALRYRAHRAR
jgi:hypothetical protein